MVTDAGFVQLACARELSVHRQAGYKFRDSECRNVGLGARMRCGSDVRQSLGEVFALDVDVEDVSTSESSESDPFIRQDE